MFKKLVMIGMITVSLSAVANNMSAAPQKKGLSVPTDSTTSRHHYEKQSRVTYVSKAPDVVKVNEASVEKPTEPASTTHPTKNSKRSGGMRY